MLPARICSIAHATAAARVGAEFSAKEIDRRCWPRAGGWRASGTAEAAECGGDSGA